MSFTPQQDAALKAVQEWFDNGTEQVFRLFGYAGTGKTTLARFFSENIKGLAQYTAFTGKACQVLRNKGCANAATLHSLIYKAENKDGVVKFILNTWESPIRNASLVICDEVSMVDEKLGKDLLSFGKKVLVLGDPAQLPPVKGSGFFMGDPDYLLTEVHRQAADNPILALATHVRMGKQLRSFRVSDDRVRIVNSVSAREALEADQIICGKNATRAARNARMRQLKGYEGVFPLPGEKLICLKNNITNGLFNGQSWEMIDSEDAPAWEDDFGRAMPESLLFSLKSLDDEARTSCMVLRENFEGKLTDLHWSILRNFDEFAFGYVITCHKSQGSQWNNVIVFDESYVFQEDSNRWLYTAITRAAEQLTIVI